jgi:tetratricopeptide (TPR) repeat protein
MRCLVAPSQGSSSRYSVVNLRGRRFTGIAMRERNARARIGSKWPGRTLQMTGWFPMTRYSFLMAIVGAALCAAPVAGSELRPDLGNTETTVQAARAMETKGDLARFRNQLQIAIADYESAIRLDSQNSNLYNKLGIVQFKLGDHQAAHKSFDQAIKLDHMNTLALNNMGALEVVGKKYKSAVRYLKQCLALDEQNASAHLNIAEAWMGLKQTDRAMTEYQRALELDPDIINPSSNGVMAQVRTPEQQARIDFLIARLYARRGNVDGALDFLTRAKNGHYPGMNEVYAYQEFAILWTDPRLAKIVKQ